jgi:chaperone modulatory protein CbpM
MIDERQLCALFDGLTLDTLHEWIDLGLVEPKRGSGNLQFDDADEARVALIFDLHHRMGLHRESLPIVLSLIDQLHGTRHSLRALTMAVTEQPDEVRIAITSRTRFVLSQPRRERR